MFNILIVVFLHPKVNIFSLTHKKKLKIFLKIFPSWGIFPIKREGAVTSFYIRNTECSLIQSKDYLGSLGILGGHERTIPSYIIT